MSAGRPCEPQFQTIAEGALLLRFGQQIDAGINARVHAAATLISRALPQVECVPAYASLLLRFEPLAWPEENGKAGTQSLQATVEHVLADGPGAGSDGREHRVPVCYGDDCGPDLERVATHSGLTPGEVIERHAGASYRVGMIGFAPGFPYLIGLDPQLATPRRADPRQRVPAGSIAIGGQQTGIYPRELPGGWQLIGRTPQRLFNLADDSPCLLAPGDRVRFEVIDAQAFRELEAGGSI